MEVKTKHGNGNHVYMDCSGCDSQILGSVEKVTDLLKELPENMGVKRLNDPVVIMHKHRKEDESGITGFVIISDSHISIHTYPNKGSAFIDIFSCKEFDIAQTETIIKQQLKPSSVEIKHNMRGKGSIPKEVPLQDIQGKTDASDIKELVKSMKHIGFQASHLSQATDLIRKMRDEKCKIFLSFTSNMVSSGLREMFAYMARHKMVDVIITSVGSIEEDIMKTEKPFLLGSFESDDKDLHKKGINRIGNIFVPSDHYEWLERKLQPFFKDILKQQAALERPLSPSEVIHELGKTVNDENSILCWATRNDIPIFCPAITDGAFGLQVYFFKQDNKEFAIDVTQDMKEIADIVLNAEKTGGIILGGGVAKHHTIGANILRDGLDYAVYVSTSSEGDGSLSGARVKEAVSWGKINETAEHVYVEGDATIIFPLIFYSMKGDTTR